MVGVALIGCVEALVTRDTSVAHSPFRGRAGVYLAPWAHAGRGLFVPAIGPHLACGSAPRAGRDGVGGECLV